MVKPAARDRLAAVLTREFGEPPFAVVEQADPALLDVEVDGAGRLKYPVTAAQARKLCALGTPARYGRGERTLTDASVRDTWEVPRTAVHLSWSPLFDKVLDRMRKGLGLPGSARLRAELHSLLVYEPGQFFLPHQDSEKHDAMVGTLAVTLPSRHSGGELVITQGGRSETCSGSASRLALCAFYADCRHEVRPVKSGYRIAVTFNLLLDGGAPQASGADAVNEAARLLGTHFATPSSAYSWGKASPPKRLVYLLDHEYTERGLSWNRLKGADADRAALLRTAAEQAGCQVMLAGTKIKETWDTYPEDSDYEDWDDEGWEDGEDDDRDRDSDGDGDGDGDGDHELNDLIERTTTLSCWVDPETGKRESISLEVGEDEVCSRTSTADFEPYEQQYEGYMGNYGNTLDRWYRRAAVVVFPDSLAFANRAEAAPAWAMRQVAERARSGNVAGARADAASLEPFWTATVSPDLRGGVFGPALKAAHAVDDPTVAAMLLAPFRSEDLLAKHAAPLSRLAKRYGGAWLGRILGTWCAGSQGEVYGYTSESRDWYSALPVLCTSLTASGRDGTAASRALLQAAWQRLAATAAPRLASPPSRRAAGLEDLGAPLAAVIAAAANMAATTTGDVIAAHLAGLGDEALPWLLSGLRSFSTVHSDSTVHGEAPGDRLSADVAADCGRRLTRRLARPARAANDWSITLPEGCSCPLCEVLADFLADPTLRIREWPLAKENRRHVHSRIEAAELPVDHQTRREGRPYTLILAKKDTLFSGERAQRAEDEADLRWILAVWPSAAVASTSAT
ncbi:2OG-Fe(II) oxygenase [Catenulispora sp. NF23]|uniref:2OG-Fe(II) oxygenase family protein n=1 Tax=Catenulispora pinistramenti TaxID=2705254 RepID=UPI001BA7590B|nr:2OG-Fe(II) oxygenase [Catenulispora pinistramenti]MBS2532950.1 2OG-Fe(II) oxygenase [Catenulispora pinistramenti]